MNEKLRRFLDRNEEVAFKIAGWCAEAYRLGTFPFVFLWRLATLPFNAVWGSFVFATDMKPHKGRKGFFSVFIFRIPEETNYKLHWLKYSFHRPDQTIRRVFNSFWINYVYTGTFLNPRLAPPLKHSPDYAKNNKWLSRIYADDPRYKGEVIKPTPQN